ncbi:MAG: VWA domain-containing protein [Rikenellaceae bacterium]|nr:VWA domain-containing protein [Rikenellaceae bacterium]
MYTARITRTHPTAFVILIDQSGSMEEPTSFCGERMSKAEAVARATNMLISELINRCRREDGCRDYFDIAVIGYSGRGIASLLGTRQTFLRPTQLAGMDVPQTTLTKERRLPNGQTVLSTMRQKQWIQPTAHADTPMCAALTRAYRLVRDWCRQRGNQSSYPPTIFNITDGEASDGSDSELIEIADKIRSVGTEDGKTLLINLHITSHAELPRTLFPSSEEELPDEPYARLLYRMSSPIPETYNEHISDLRDGATAFPVRGISYNASATELVGMMNIGTVSATIT